MSQLTLTAAEAVLALNAVRAKHAQTLSAYGFDDLELAAFLARMEAHAAPVVESAPAATEVVEPEVVVEATEETPAEE